MPPRYDALKIGLSPDREVLYQRIDRRVDDMVARGLVAEVEALRAAGYRPPLRSQEAIGYAEIHAYLDNSLELPVAIEQVKRNSRRYARRQCSWYRNDQDVRWSPQPDAVDHSQLERYLKGPNVP